MGKIIAVCLVWAFFASVALAGPVTGYKSKVPVMRGERVEFAGKKFWVWESAGKKFINRVDPFTKKMVRLYL